MHDEIAGVLQRPKTFLSAFDAERLHARFFDFGLFDGVFNILKWRDSDEIGKLARLVVVTRPGYILNDARRRYMRTHASILHMSSIEVTALSISSTDLREKVKEGRSIRYLVPQPVAEYIQYHGLYTGVS